jgi:hypothetical protein
MLYVPAMTLRNVLVYNGLSLEIYAQYFHSSYLSHDLLARLLPFT